MQDAAAWIIVASVVLPLLGWAFMRLVEGLEEAGDAFHDGRSTKAYVKALHEDRRNWEPVRRGEGSVGPSNDRSVE